MDEEILDAELFEMDTRDVETTDTEALDTDDAASKNEMGSVGVKTKGGNKNRRFYFLSLIALVIVSAYPLIHGISMTVISLSNGVLEPDQYANYVVPYTAICVSLVFFAAMLPLFMRMKRLAFPVGIGLTCGLFFVVERFFENMQIRVSRMTLIDTSTLSPVGTGSSSNATADAWQAALCVVSPDARGQSLTYASQDSFFYVLADSTYKIHYYLISLVLILMVCGLIYGIAKMLRTEDISQRKPLFLRGVSTATLVALCVFANSTAFFRQAAPIQTPLASILTALFFVVLGAAVGIYCGSYLLSKGKRLGITIPLLLSIAITILMYVGEAAMMQGNLYRFGSGWFFSGLPGIVLAPVDILVVLLSGGLTCLALSVARKHERWPGRRMMVVAASFCAFIAFIGPAAAIIGSTNADEDILGSYVFEKNIYTNPLSSFMAFGRLPYVYIFSEDTFIIAVTDSDDTDLKSFFITDPRTGTDTPLSILHSYSIEYCRIPVGLDEFSSGPDFPAGSIFSPPSLVKYKERFLLAVMTDDNGSRFRLYRMDRNLWLVEFLPFGIWTIYQLERI